MTPDAIKQFQTSLGVPVTGVIDAGTIAAMNKAVASSIAAHPEISQYANTTDPSAIANAYMTGDWSGVTDLTGKPFTDEQQQAAVDAATQVLGPAYDAQKAYDTANTTDTLRNNQETLSDTEDSNKRSFVSDKAAADQDAANNGILFSGARAQKLNDLRTTYAERDAIARRTAAENAASTARTYQYNYGNDAAKSLSDYYTLPGANTYNVNVPGGGGAVKSPLSAVYSPDTYNFQGTQPVAQTTAIQTRAATQLANKANKLSLAGYATKF